MFETMILIATFLAATVMGQALAHAMEMPGKMRLERQDYYTVQTIYYPGFTIGGVAEPLSILSAAAALLALPPGHQAFWLIGSAAAALAATHLLFWLVVQPVNRQWLQSIKLSRAGEQFFRTGERGMPTTDWTRLRDRWEWGHVARSVTSTAAFVIMLLATASAD